MRCAYTMLSKEGKGWCEQKKKNKWAEHKSLNVLICTQLGFHCCCLHSIKVEKEQRRTEEERRIERLKNLDEERMEMAEREHRSVQELRTTATEKTQEAETKLRERKDREATRYARRAEHCFLQTPPYQKRIISFCWFRHVFNVVAFGAVVSPLLGSIVSWRSYISHNALVLQYVASYFTGNWALFLLYGTFLILHVSIFTALSALSLNYNKWQ